MKTLKTALLLCTMTLLSSNLMAQPSNRPNHKAKDLSASQIAQRKTDRMTKQLELTDAQAKKVYKLELASAEAQVASREAAKEQRELRRAQAVQTKSDLASILDDRQQKRLAEIQSQNKRGGKSQMQGRSGAPRQAGPKAGKAKKEKQTPEQIATKLTERMTEQLALNETQVTEIYDLNLRNAKFKQEQREVKVAHQKESKSELSEILTDEQEAQLKANRKANRGEAKPRGGNRKPTQRGGGHRG